MDSRYRELPRTHFSQSVAGAQFGEHHLGIVNADLLSTWEALHATRWSEVAGAAVLLRARGIGFGGRLDRTVFEVFAPHATMVREAPYRSSFLMVGQPWSPVPRSRPAMSFAEVAAFAEPGWLKYGMDWTLTELDPARTLVETRTLCEATSPGARRAFAAYWAVIRPWSGLLRHGMLAAIARRAENPT